MNSKINIIASSSKGNCYIYNQDLMIDVGVSYNKTKDYLKDIKLILLTHQHSDHFKNATIKKISYEFPNIKFVCGWFLVSQLLMCGVHKKNIFVLELNKKYDLGKYIIEPVMAVHDVPNFGYKIEIVKEKYKIFHITDTRDLSHIEAKEFDLYSIEGNYETDEELYKKIKEEREKYGFSYRERVLKTHISMLDAINWYDKNKGGNSEIVLLHQHIDRKVGEKDV